MKAGNGDHFEQAYNAQAAVEVESKAEAGGTQVYAAVEKTGHHRSVEDLERKEDPKENEAEASTTERMRHRMKTQIGVIRGFG